MQLKPPNLDDRNFDQLLAEAKDIIRKKCPQWTDLSPGDPGIVILEVFAHLTETMIYRLNRLPEKAYVEFLRLIGVKLSPPTAASTKLIFALSKPQDTPVEIPRGTRVTLARAGGGEPPPVFVVLRDTTIPANELQAKEVDAYHCELVEEIAGTATGAPGFSVTAKRPPIVAETNDDLELIVGVEADPEELTSMVRSLDLNNKPHVVWREVEDFSNLISLRMSKASSNKNSSETRDEKKTPQPQAVEEDQRVYVVDRMTGTITFAPAVRLQEETGKVDQTPQALGEVPKKEKLISLRYCSGGGLAGNVAANTLTTLKDPIPGVTVTNPKPATGGRDAETLENALVRGPQQLHSLQRAVTARDFELVALRSSGAFARAYAYTKASRWKHAEPGTVEVLLVPDIAEKDRKDGVVTEEALEEHWSQEAVQTVTRALDEAKPLTTKCEVDKVGYKEVKVEAEVIIHRGEDAKAVQSRVLKRLHQTINPLPSSLPSTGWAFGNPLRVSHVYDIMLAEPGVNYVESVRLVVKQVPGNDITALAADAFQSHTWYATTGSNLFRSMDDGKGWELIWPFPDGQQTDLANHPEIKKGIIKVNNFKPGQVAVVTRPASGEGSCLWVSDDCGENWRNVKNFGFKITDVAWIVRQNTSYLMITSDKGLHELEMRPDLSNNDEDPLLIIVDKGNPQLGLKGNPELGLNAVAVAVGARGHVYVAVAVRSSSGVSMFFSSKGGASESFEPLTLKDKNIGSLQIEQADQQTFLWAAIAGGGQGEGAFRWELQGPSAGTHTPINLGWDAGSCYGLAISGGFAFAGSFDKGVMWLEMKGEQTKWRWKSPVKESGLKPREDNELKFQPVTTVAAAAQPISAPATTKRKNIVMGGGVSGIYLSEDNGAGYRLSSAKEFIDKVTVSPTWLFVSGEHQVKVVSADEPK